MNSILLQYATKYVLAFHSQVANSHSSMIFCLLCTSVSNTILYETMSGKRMGSAVMAELDKSRSYKMTFLSMVLTIVLGPQLAIKPRTVGSKNAEAGGKIVYRLALGGLLLGLALILLQWTIMTNGVYIWLTVR